MSASGLRAGAERSAHDAVSGTPRVAVYARVSTTEQAREGDSINQQPRMCLELLEKEFGKDGFDFELFVDAGKSGSLGPFVWENEPKRKHRPALRRLIQGVRDGRFTHVCAYRLDRLYRNFGGWAALVNLLQEKGARVLLVAEPFDESISGGLAMDIMARVAQFQLELNTENIRTSMARRRKDGHWMGPAPYGWLSSKPEERVAPDERPPEESE